MTDLSDKSILIIDCQTTGMHPRTSHLLQIGWCLFDPHQHELPRIEKRLLKLPPHISIPEKIKTMLQISEAELVQSLEPKKVFEQFQQAVKELGDNPVVLAHYARFEYQFLKTFFLEQTSSDQLNFKLLCTQQIAKRLLSNLPSYNLKALAGYYKLETTPKNEIISHVTMTYHIWHQLLTKLQAQKIDTYSELENWLSTKLPPHKTQAYEYNVEKFSRLDISKKPGIYYMLARDGAILYVGKATSLKSRVNSYFRGIKNRNKRTLEMLTQVWDIKTIECNTPLEAELLESDEIKKWNPPYNILLKENHRRIIFYNKDYSQHSDTKEALFYNGPYRPFDSVMNLMALITAIRTHAPLPYEEEHTREQVAQGWKLFCQNNGVEDDVIEQTNWRIFFTIGYKLLKRFESEYGKSNFEQWWRKQKTSSAQNELGIEQQIAQKIARWFIRAAETKRKSIQLRRLSNASIVIKATHKRLQLMDGEFVIEQNEKVTGLQNKSFGLPHYDRLSILLAAKNKNLISFV